MWRFEFPGAIVYRFRDGNRYRTGLGLLAASLIAILLAAWVTGLLRYALLGSSVLAAVGGAWLLFRMRSLVIDRARRLLLLEERRPLRQTLRRIFSLDCVRLRLEMRSVRWGRDAYRSLWIENQCDGEQLQLLDRSPSLRCDTSRLESDLGRPLLVVVR